MNNNEEKKDPLLLAHNYDGIEECDYPLPKYWVVTFLLCIIFAVLYFFYYEVFGGKGLQQEYVDEITAYEAKIKSQKPADDSFNQEKFNALFANKDELKKGEEIFVNNCMVCHKDKAQGDIGPNLTDNYWLIGDGSPKAIHAVVANGSEANGMPPWKDTLSDEEIYHVIAYVKSLKGVTLPEAKAPQGQKYE